MSVSIQSDFCWLHLSDIHFGHGTVGQKLGQKLVWDELSKDIQKVVDRYQAPFPDAIFVTGDITFSGGISQYEVAKAHLEELARKYTIPWSYVLTVPGNHDVQRQTNEDNSGFMILLESSRDNHSNLDELWDQTNFMNPLRERFGNYTSILGLDWPWVQKIQANRLKIRIVGINTACLSSRGPDKGKLAIGQQQLLPYINGQVEDDEIVIVLGHHPLEWLSDADSIEKTLRRFSHIYMYGHVHDSKTVVSEVDSQKRWMSISAGAAHREAAGVDGLEDGHKYSIGWITAIPKTGHLHVNVLPRAYSSRHRRFVPDHDGTDEFGNPQVKTLNLPSAFRKDLGIMSSNSGHGAALIFDAKNMAEVKAAIDSETRRRIHQKQRFLGSVADRFGSLFNIGDLTDHPLFNDLDSTLEYLTRGIVLNEEKGILQRTGTRHVVLRAETIHLIMEAVPTELLAKTAKQIGEAAAKDLIENVLKDGNYIPTDAEAFVALWDFWDSSGGWGKLRLEEDDSDSRWNIIVENSFLVVCSANARGHIAKSGKTNADIGTTERLSCFWKSYIHGFLAVSLPEIRLMMLKNDQFAEKVFIPRSVIIAEDGVTHSRDWDTGIDVYTVHFQEERLSEPVQLLKGAFRLAQKGEFESSILLAKTSVEKLREKFPEIYSVCLNELETAGKERAARLNKLVIAGELDTDVREKALADARWLVFEVAQRELAS